MNNRKFIRVLDFSDKIIERVGKATSFLIILMLVVTIYIGMARTFTWLGQITLEAGEMESAEESGDPIGIYTDIHTVYVVLGAAYVLYSGGHICFDVLSRRFSPRVRATLELATYPLLIFLFAVLLWKITPLVPEMLSDLISEERVFSGKMLPRLWSGISSTIVFWPIGIALLLLGCLTRWSRNLLHFIAGRESRE